MHDHLNGPLSPILSTETDLNVGTNFRKFRTELRTKILADKLLNDDTDMEFVLDFYGSGDSGDWSDSLEDALMQHMFDYVLHHHVYWDWYNNDGGGGTIRWDVRNDEIHVDGYWNEIIAHSENGCILGPDDDDAEEAEEEAA